VNALYNWLKPKTRRDVLTFVGGGVAAVVIAAWAVVTHEPAKKDVSTPTMNASPSITVNPTISPTIQQNPIITVAPQTAPLPTIEATYQLCHADDDWRRLCPKGSVFLNYNDSLAEWAKKKCREFQTSDRKTYQGGAHGAEVVTIKCTAYQTP
jgi:hypothetical protein